jgi:hypothetical protein
VRAGCPPEFTPISPSPEQPLAIAALRKHHTPVADEFRYNGGLCIKTDIVDQKKQKEEKEEEALCKCIRSDS